MKHDVKLVGSKAPASPRQACLALACLALFGVADASEAPPPNVARIIAEASRQNSDPGGRPLPLASSWNSGVGSWGLTGYPHYAPRPRKPGHLDLHQQLELLLAGHHWLPVSQFPFHLQTKAQDPNGSAWFNHAGHFEPWDTFAAWGLPLTLYETQFDAPLYNQAGTTDQWVKLPPSQNPCVIRNGLHLLGTLEADAVATTAGINTVRVTLPGVTGLADDLRIWFTQEFAVGGLPLNGERWSIATVEALADTGSELEAVTGSVITFVHQQPATATATGGKVAYEIAHVNSVADPLGPVEPWYEVGQWWLHGFRREAWENLWQRYPQPPRIIFLSNHEGRLPGPKDRNLSKRFVDAYGEQTDYAFGAKTMKEGYATRFRRLFQGLRDSMPEAWAAASTMVAYNAVFTSHYGRWGGWRESAVGDLLALDIEATSWEGASPEYYLNAWEPSTDYTVYSPQTAFMNVKWQLDLVYQAHPEFWYEMSIWDGFPKKRAWFESNADPFTPERYKAWLQYGMWLTRPRVVREFRGSEALHDTGIAYFEKFLEAVDDVYADPLKTRFWRLGTVVPNSGRPHPFQVAPLEKHEAVERWFNLDTSLDRFPPPGQNVPLDTEIPVWALALVVGQAPQREWLLYAYAPQGNRQTVTIAIPDYGEVTLDVPQAGIFRHLVEAGASQDQ